MLRESVIWAACLLASCSFDFDFSGTRFQCSSGECPSGYACLSGLCELDSNGDASPPEPCPPGGVITSTIGTAGRDFSTIGGWESAREGSLGDRLVLRVREQRGQFSVGEVVSGGGRCGGTYVPGDDGLTNGSILSLDMVVDITPGTCAAGTVLRGEFSRAAVTVEEECFEGTLEEGVLYADSPFGENVVISGSRTQPGHFMRLTVAPGQRHDGTAGTGARIQPQAAGHGVHIADDLVELEWVEVTEWAHGSAAGFDGIHITGNFSLVQYVIVHDDGHGAEANSDADGIALAGPDLIATVRNSIVYRIARSAVSIRFVSQAVINLENSTIFDCMMEDVVEDIACVDASTSGINLGSTINVRNVVALRSGLDVFGTTGMSAFGEISSNNLSSDGTCPGCGAMSTFLDPADIFEQIDSDGNIDLHIKPGSRPIDSGLDLSAEFSKDIDGEDRPSLWDIGADERVP